ncbi:hypothetical protein ACFOLH_07655 [Aquipuribacter hungaricus]|uniref:Uncharacterized protein n=2 Tax=Aquipuribacter hungaricus TaxID=545624 RepID=A0ABV7WEJ5_9MICO
MSRARSLPGRAGLGAGAFVVGAVALAGCARGPGPAAAPAPRTTPAPVVLADQAEQVRAEVADRLLEARVAGDEELVGAGATGPAALLEALRVRVDGPVADATAAEPLPAAVLVAPQAAGWPRWFATVTDPSTAPAPAAPADLPTDPPTDLPSGAPSGQASSDLASGEPLDPASAAPSAGDLDATTDGTAAVAALPVLELYTSEDVRLPYRLWGRLTLLPGAELPSFPAAEIGALPLAVGEGPDALPSGDPSAGAAPVEEDEDAEDDGAAEDEAELLAAVTDLASRYASVLADGDASAAAAEFEPDPFVEAVRARTVAEATAVQGVAGTLVEHGPLDGVEVLYAARSAGGDLLAVTAVETTVTMTPRSTSGVLRPGPEVRAAAGVEETDDVLTTRSVAALAFVVPAEQGAIRLVAVGEGLVSAETG